MQERTWDVVIAGGGPAGLSAALMLGRAGRRVAVVDSHEPRNRFATHMHGVLGHDGLPPAALAAKGRSECAGYGVVFLDTAITSIDATSDLLTVQTEAGEHKARTVILATGATDELPSIPGLQEQWGSRALHCPYCHGFEVRGRRLGVLATQPMSLHHAEIVRQWSDSVTFYSAAMGPLDPAVAARLESRNVVLEPRAVVNIQERSDGLTLSLADGDSSEVDAVFVMSRLRPHDEIVAGLNLDRTDTPFGSFLAVDASGATSDERVFAVGNVVHPAATVVLSMAQGASAGAAANARLVGWDFDQAEAARASEFWEQKYSSEQALWSGRVNVQFADVVSALQPGRALDLGCGEGADVLWLASRGWQALGLDLSATAIARATAAAKQLDAVAGHAQFQQADLAQLSFDGEYDLVSANFLHAPVSLPRHSILKHASSLVAPGGHLVVTTHVTSPSTVAGSQHEHGNPGHGDVRFATPEEDLSSLGLDPQHWQSVIVETRPREITGPDGRSMTIDDGVLVLQRTREGYSTDSQ